MKICTKCILPETHAHLKFDKNGVCSLCDQIERKFSINWKERENILEKIFDKYRGKGKYDCLLPYSGGKDSAFQAYTLVKRFRMNPLVYTFNHTFLTSTGMYNLFNGIQKLNLEHIVYTPNKEVVRKLMLLALKEYGDWCWFCHGGISGSSKQIAIKYNIPLIIWGESGAEYSTAHTFDDFREILDSQVFEQATVDNISYKHFIGKLGLTENDLQPFKFPTKEEIKKMQPPYIRSIHLGNYIKWDTKKQVELIKQKLDWRDSKVEGSYVTYDKQECRFVGVRDYCKYLKRGYGRTAHLASIAIREGKITRKEALELEKKFDGKRPATLDTFLDEIGITEKEFMKIMKNHVIDPWKPIEYKDRPKTGSLIKNTNDPLTLLKS